MSKWEDKYEKLKSGEFNDRIDELKQKVEDRNATREELKEYKTLSKSKENLNQVKNVIEYRDLTRKKLNNIKNEITFRENMKKANEENIKLEVEMELLMKEIEKISERLKDPSLKKEDKSKLLDKQKELKTNIGQNNEKYSKNQAVLDEGLNDKRDELKKYSIEDLNKMKLEASSRISKCNMVCNSLVNGLSWDSIGLKLDNWQERRFTSKEKTPIKDKTEKNKNENTEFKDIISDPEALKRNEDLRKAKEGNNFDDKHPKLAKIKNWFKSRFGRSKNALPEPQNPNKENDEGEVKKENKEAKSFKEYIKEIAEKGMDGIAAEEKAARQEAAKAKLDEMRKANRASEANKFGKDYADKSDYRNKDDEEER